MSGQAWYVVATTEQRFYLADLLLQEPIKGKGRKWDSLLWRARGALGLYGLTELLGRGGVRMKLILEPVSHAFLVTAENAEFLLECRDKVELPSGRSHVLRPLLEQLAEPNNRSEPPEGMAEWTDELDAAELELWRPPKPSDPPPADAG